MPKAGDMVLVPFPFTDLSGSKVRPALILGVQKSGDDITVCFVSSHKQNKKYPGDVILKESDKKFDITGLKTSSIIKVTKIATLDKAVILGKIGELDKNKLQEVKKLLKTYFKL